MGTNHRHEVIMAGLGGQGVLLAGLLLAEAGLSEYSHIVWTPSYATRVRGGPSECTVILSSKEIYSPLLSQAQYIVLMDQSYLLPFQERVRPGGAILIEGARSQDRVGRSDVKLLPIPGQEIALKLGDKLAANMVMLGAYVGASKAILPESMETILRERFAGKPERLSLNLEAFRKGLRMLSKYGG